MAIRLRDDGATVLAAGLPAAFALREQPAATQFEKEVAGGAALGEGLRSRVFWIIVIVLFFSSISQNGAIAHLAALLTDRGVAPAQAARAMSVMGAAVLAGRLITGWLLDRYFAPRVACCLLVFGACGTFLQAGARTMAGGALGAALIGFGMGGEADVTPYLIAKYFGLRSFSTLYGFTWTAYAIAGAIGPVIMGMAYDATGTYQALLTRLALATLGAASLMLWMPRIHEPAAMPVLAAAAE